MDNRLCRLHNGDSCLDIWELFMAEFQQSTVGTTFCVKMHDSTLQFAANKLCLPPRRGPVWFPQSVSYSPKTFAKNRVLKVRHAIHAVPCAARVRLLPRRRKVLARPGTDCMPCRTSSCILSVHKSLTAAAHALCSPSIVFSCLTIPVSWRYSLQNSLSMFC